ncbi:hypothetical protein [Planctomicrobium piriforme]|uniref:Uncharacterized protein n=1 Tax=Planctomicrobium piriforme TaxID=1576369 RepID=A0A1I3HIN1_9PLAN|nr:hypothetical protein [Planctomicrobium piriforme]SFI35479.1 hypothetical protein SAMN05421753_10877 [Planctomicrobium piriforme]
MSVNLVSDENLRAALQPYQVDPQTFEAGVRTKIATGSKDRVIASGAALSPLLRAAAVFLPLSMLGCRGSLAAAKLAPTSAGAKLLGYLAFPAITLFMLLGAAVLSVLKIRGLRHQNHPEVSGQIAKHEAVQQWWRDHKWGARVVFVASLMLGMFGASWLLFLFYILSFGILLSVITSLARLGIGSRFIIGSSCLLGLMFLGQAAAFSGMGAGDIHFLDQSLVPAVFYGGVVVIAILLLPCQFHTSHKMEGLGGTVALTKTGRLITSMLFVLIVLPSIGWFLYPTLFPATPMRIKHYVESFDHARFSSASWRKWEIPASWSIQSNLEPDLSKPRQLLGREIAGEQNPYILSTASRVGLLSADQIDQIKDYEKMLRSVLPSSPRLKSQRLTNLEQYDWVIRAAVLLDDLSTEDRDILEQRLHATLQTLPGETYVNLGELLHATQLLDVIKRPVNPEQYRAKVHALLREFHSQDSGGFQLAGGFRKYRKSEQEGENTWTQVLLGSGMPGDLDATSDAIELMTIYGAPDDLNLNWVRSFLRPRRSGNSDGKWISAVTLDRLNQLPDAHQPTWMEYVYYERTLLAAAVLVFLCIFATLSSPTSKTGVAANS